ncbi:hypothetical protein [Nonomuraea candida]|uniref:hypothetical protein n=1 Tax=Nonomuraea candida TaxID=359159 RepID=UPI0005B9D994|nr:hypothetical protein [Nonomuraea candida]
MRTIVRPRPRRRLSRKLTSVQLWAAVAGIIGSLTAVPALIISTNALKISEKQLADARRLKAETDLATQRAFVQRVSVDTETALINRGPIVISNGNTTSTSVEVYLGYIDDPDTRQSPGEYQTIVLAAPACSRVSYRTSFLTEEQFKGIDADNVQYSLDLAVFNPIDQRWWSVSEAPRLLRQDEMADYRERGYTSSFPHPHKSTALPGCV